MLLDAEQRGGADDIHGDVAIVGAGPAGIVVELDLAQHGLDVVLVESGGRKFQPSVQDLGNAAEYDPARHAPMEDCTRRQIGGASVIWGGRCVPYDPIDFEHRTYVSKSDWPVTYDEISSYFQRACDYFRCGRAVFDAHEIDAIEQKTIVPGLPDAEVRSSSLERWSLPTNFGHEFRRDLESSRRIQLLHSLTCTEIEVDDSGSRVTALRCRSLGSGRALEVTARAYVIACGGIDTTRLLLASNRVHANGIGNHSDNLGRFYMGHISGRVARVCFTTPPRRTIYGFERDIDGTYLKRRFSFSPEFQREHELNNIVSFPVSPDIADPEHHNGVLSFAYLALASPMGRAFAADAIRKAAIGSGDDLRLLQHTRNMLLDPWSTLKFVPTFGYKRFIAHRKVPSFIQYSRSGIYPLHYHGEQVPNRESRITLSDQRDELGMRRVSIDLRYTDRDVDSVVRAHQYWDRYLRDQDCGRLEYLADDVEQSVWNQAGDGFHQIGTTRMSSDPERSVVGPDCSVHGVGNLFVASSSIFVTSGQANSTFMIVAFALRMADHLREVTLAREV